MPQNKSKPDIEIPKEVNGFKVVASIIPIDRLRPGHYPEVAVVCDREDIYKDRYAVWTCHYEHGAVIAYWGHYTSDWIEAINHLLSKASSHWWLQEKLRG